MLSVAACLQELPAQQVQQLLDQVLQRDVQPLLHKPPQQLGDAGQQFVMSRALMLGAELQEAASAHQKEHLLQAAAAAGQAAILLVDVTVHLGPLYTSMRIQHRHCTTANTAAAAALAYFFLETATLVSHMHDTA